MLAPAVSQPDPTGAPPRAPDAALAPSLLSLDKLRKQFERFLGDKVEEIEEAKDARRQYHGVQWSSEEMRILKDRGQPPSTYNKIARKVDGIVGISEKQRQDPKAYPRNPSDDHGADVATCVVRYITESNEWTSKKPHALRQALTEGIAGVEFRLVDGDRGDPDVKIEPIAGEDFFYDPASVHPTFTDARFMGLSKWLDVEEAIELFPDREDDIRGLIGSGDTNSLSADRDNRWTRRAENRLRMVEHWYVSKSEWCWAFYIGSTVLAEGVSPFIDQRKKTMCRFQMFSACVDQDGDRYGIVRNLKPLQKEINQRVSILLRLALTRRLIVQTGGVDDIEVARKQWARPDGVVEVLDMAKIKADDTQQQVAEHTALLSLAMDQMEGFYNINPAALAGPSGHNLSGRAVNLLQAPGFAELSLLLINYRNWIIRCYRMAWNLAQHFWTAERWIRVTDDQGVAQYVQLNGFDLDQYGQPALVNALGALDVDLILDEGPDVQNSMQDALDVLANFLPSLPPGSIPLDVLFSLMPIPASIKQKMEAHANQPPDPLKVQGAQLQIAQAGANVDKTHADTHLKQAQALSALGSAAHKTSEAHINGAAVFDGGLQATGMNQPQQPPAPQAPAGPLQPQVPPGANLPPTRIGPNLPVIPGAMPGVNAALGG